MDMSRRNMDDTEDNVYSWEVDYERTWEKIRETDEGFLQPEDDEHSHKAKKRLLLASSGKVKLGVFKGMCAAVFRKSIPYLTYADMGLSIPPQMRHVIVIVDCSKAMEDKDLKPNRYIASLKMIENFVLDFFDHNPISQLGIIATKDGKAEKISELCCNTSKLLSLLKTQASMSCKGEPSLQNACEMALRTVKNTPLHVSREILLILGAITSCDPGDIHDTIKGYLGHKRTLKRSVHRSQVSNQRTRTACGGLLSLPFSDHIFLTAASSINIPQCQIFLDINELLNVKDASPNLIGKKLQESAIRCSVIGLSAEVRICRVLSQKTGGSYDVIMSETHFKEVLANHVRPPVAKATTESSLIRMGFPVHNMEGVPSFCVCHLNMSGSKLSKDGYFCPQCYSKYCELPVDCSVCGLTLVLAPHLSRSNRHLSPLPAFVDISVESQNTCIGCQVHLPTKGYQCTKCASCFCIDCDIFIHETLYFCPGCQK